MGEQPAQIEALREQHPHSISLVEPEGPSPYNCVQYAFDLPEEIRRGVDRLKNGGQEAGTRVAPGVDPLGGHFVSFLIQKGVLRQLNGVPRVGSIIVYWNEQTAYPSSVVRHVGKIFQGERVISKWNYGGHLWKHGVYEVSIGCGEPRFVESIPTHVTCLWLSRFMEEIGRHGAHRRKDCIVGLNRSTNQWFSERNDSSSRE